MNTSVRHSNGKLPTELLLQIFLEALSTKQGQPQLGYPHLYLSLVCRQWREIINGFKEFWTVIRFLPWKGEELIWTFVSRSGSAKLSVFSPSSDDAGIDEGSGIRRARYRDSLTTFIELLQREGHRIKFLFLTGDRYHQFPAAVLGTVLQVPVLKTFVFKELFDLKKINPEISRVLAKCDKALATIINSTKCLENLNILLSSESSLSSLIPSLSRLKILNVRFTSPSLRKLFCITLLPSCSTLESLAVFTTSEEWEMPRPLPSVITLPNLITLNTGAYSLIDKLRAPALKTLEIVGAGSRALFAPQSYMVFDEYDLSSVTHLSIRGVDLLCHGPKILIHGSAGPLVRYKDPSAFFKHTNNQSFDSGGDISLSASSSDPTYFYIWAPAHFYHNTIAISVVLLSKISPKLINLEVLYMNSFDGLGYIPSEESLALEDLSRLKEFFRQIVDNLVSSNLRWLIIGDLETSVNTLRSMFKVLNGCPSLSSLETFTFGTYSIKGRRVDISVARDFAEKLVNFLKLRRKAGLKPLLKFEIYSQFSLPEICVAKATALGTEIVQHAYKSGWFDDLRECR